MSKAKYGVLLAAISLVLALTVLATVLTGCASSGGETVQTADSMETEVSEEDLRQQEEEQVSYAEGKLELILDTDLLWGDAEGGSIPQSDELEAATGKIYDLASRHDFAVEEFELLGPYGGDSTGGAPGGKGRGGRPRRAARRSPGGRGIQEEHIKQGVWVKGAIYLGMMVESHARDVCIFIRSRLIRKDL